MPTISEAMAIALEHHQAGRLPQAEAIYQQILQTVPNHAEALHALGIIAHQVGKHELAIEHIERAIQNGGGTQAHFHNNLGEAYRAAGRVPEAIAAYQRAIQLDPNLAEVHYNLGLALESQGKPDQAVAAFQRALQLKPDYADAHNDLGIALYRQRRLDEAVATFERSVNLRQDARTYNNLGLVLLEQGKFEAAITAFDRAMQLQPGFAGGHYNLGNALRARGRFDEAVAAYERALQADPTLADAANNLGIALCAQGKLGLGMAAYHRALQINPNFAPAHNNLGNVWKDLGNLDEALAAYRRAVELQPGSAEAHSNLGVMLMGIGKLDEGIACHRQALKLRPDFPEARSSLLVSLNWDPRVDPQTLLAEHRRWESSRAAIPARRRHSNDRNPERRLRIGYASTDLRRHATVRWIEPFLTHHDHHQVEVFAYAEVANPDAVTARLQTLVDGWRSTCALTDADAADLIARDGIDILVDLAGHTGGGRLGIFLHKPAPIQITYLGYPSTTGLSTIDYRLTDAVADRPDDPPCHSEELVYLPGGYCWRPFEQAPEVTALPALARGYVVFGSCQSPAKLNEGVLDLWASILRAVPASRLLLSRDALKGTAGNLVRSQLNRRGIGDEQIDMRFGAARGGSHLEIYSEIDIVLDTLPWTGGATTIDALWMGVPVITLYGNRHAGRVSASHLTQVGLPELIAYSPERYIALAVELAGDIDRLKQLRSTLRERVRNSRLCDGKTFTRNLEKVYRTLWRRWCASVAP